MFDFFEIATRVGKKGSFEIYPEFMVCSSKDIMIRGGKFHAIWDESVGLWTTDKGRAIELIDNSLKDYRKEVSEREEDENYRVLTLRQASTGMIDAFNKFCEKQMTDNYHALDEKVIFANTPVNKLDYASKRLSYNLAEGSTEAYDNLMSVLYDPEERHKLEWAIGSVITGDSKTMQKFFVLYGSAGTGKSTVLNIIQKMFDGYWSAFDSKALGSANDQFALESFRDNPLLGIEHDGDLSRIEDNTRINSIVSHEEMRVNEKFKSTYVTAFKSLLIMGTNKHVKITDAKSGLMRRLIDVFPTGEKVPIREYKKLIKQIDFELGAIAFKCKQIYENNQHAYDHYEPIRMMGASNSFFNFMLDHYHVFDQQDAVSLKQAWEMYKVYVEEALEKYPYAKMRFKEELRNYFKEYSERAEINGKIVRGYYSEFLRKKFEINEDRIEFGEQVYISFEEIPSAFDAIAKEYISQYANTKGNPKFKWENITTILSDLDTSKLHYVKVPENHIVIDFDLKDVDGNKSYERNLEEASKWPRTYAELSKSGCGIHLHYIYNGDTSLLAKLYAEDIEIKVFKGGAALRRKLTKCSNDNIAEISSGLPLKEKKGNDVVDFNAYRTEKGLRDAVKRALRKEVHPDTSSNINFIHMVLNQSYDAGLKYDLSDLKPSVISFAGSSTNQSERCLKMVQEMKFKSEEDPKPVTNENAPIVFYDIECFKNLFVVRWKIAEDEEFWKQFDFKKKYPLRDIDIKSMMKNPIEKMINPTPLEIEELMNNRLIGFNNRKYDNHMLYAASMGYTNKQLYNLSQRLISNGEEGKATFSNAYNISYTDIYCFSSTKKSLKKFEIELGMFHDELGIDWDSEVDINSIDRVVDYCGNDVVASEVVFNYRQSDFLARKILADLANGVPNETTNSLTTKLMFGNERKPQSQFNYVDLSEMFPGYEFDPMKPKGKKSTYRGFDVGEGGWVLAEPGMYGNVGVCDVISMHINSAINMNMFGKYTRNYKEMLDARVLIKHGEIEKAKNKFDGKLKPYLENKDNIGGLSDALKLALVSVAGLTCTPFANPFRDPRNVDNIMQKRGALFMIDLYYSVIEQGYNVIHIKTDSIKIPDADEYIIKFVMDFGKKYGYEFEHEETFEKMCLVNDAVFIAKVGWHQKESKIGSWEAVGAQFAVSYVFKTLFSKEEIEFEDLCEIKSVSKGKMYLDFNEDLPVDEHNYQFIGKNGRFCPIKSGFGGGELRVIRDTGSVAAVAGSKGYRWHESEYVRLNNLEHTVDMSYFEKLATKAAETIIAYGDYNWFVSDDIYSGPQDLGRI